MSAANSAWPYEREQPDLVLLPPREGTTPSAKPPVRIFLGTEEGQYRAERVFVYSVERFRDPARAYEIHLMKNLAGFNRKGWRTGFTCYRFAIPDLAGGSGKAIYNDVDQIYLADPALLFDLPLNGHGYLAISARDTSVMLIDCARMKEWWNRPAASLGKKGPLTNVPAGTPGLWGQLDPHWNARDMEYVEGRTRCLHYTALHQQPWNPFPEAYSYHQNPFAYLWHDLERQADEAGFEVFTAAEPSPGFKALVGSNHADEVPTGAPPPSAAARALIAGEVLTVSLGGSSPVPGSTRHLDLRRQWDAWPGEPADTVVVHDVFLRLPPADIGWVLGEAFAHARRTVLIQLAAQAESGLGSPAWWRRRVEEVAARHPAVSWRLEVGRASGSVESFERRQSEAPAAPRVWVLTGGEKASDHQAECLAEALGWSFEVKRLGYGPAAALPNAALGASLRSLDAAAAASLKAPWPDLVLTADSRAVPAARWIRAQSGHAARLVQLGRPAAPFELFDLILATPEQRLPIRRNVLQLAAPLAGGEQASSAQALDRLLPGLQRPVTALIVGKPQSPFVLDAASVPGFAVAAKREAGGSLVGWLDPTLGSEVRDGLKQALGADVRWLDTGGAEAKRALLAGAERSILVAGDPEPLLEACLGGKPVLLFALPRWQERLPVLKPVARALASLVGGSTYRGTPLQQHFPGRILDWLVTQGLVYRPRDLDALHRSLEARGLLSWIGSGETVASRKPLDDLARSVERVRRLLRELPQAS